MESQPPSHRHPPAFPGRHGEKVVDGLLPEQRVAPPEEKLLELSAVGEGEVEPACRCIYGRIVASNMLGWCG